MKNLTRYIIVTLTAFFFVSLAVDPIQAKTVHFKDVQSDSFYYEAVMELSSEGIMNGFSDGTFKPEEKITRVHAAIVLAELFQLEIKNVSDPIFTDIPTSHPYYKEISAVAKAGMMKGNTNKTFTPDRYLTRAEMAQIIVEAFTLNKQESQSSFFKDVKPGQWYADSVHTLVNYEITSGITPTTFGPNNHVTRGQFAVFIERAKNTHITVAGNGEYGSKNGKSLEASFRSPSSIALLNNGSMLISDSNNHLIRQISNDLVSTFAGMIFSTNDAGQLEGGLYDDQRESALFSKPSGISVDHEGNIYVADSANHAIRKISINGEVSTIAGNGHLGYTDGQREQALLYSPQDIAVSKDGIVYVADTLNHVIRKIDLSGKVTTLNAPSTRTIEVVGGVAELVGDYKDGKLSEAKFNEPSGLALDSKGNLYVSDTGNQLIRYINFANNTVSTVAGKFAPHSNLYANGGHKDGIALEAQFSSPKGIFVTTEGGLLIADSLNHAIRYLKDGQVQTIGRNLNNPSDVIEMKESILVVDSFSNRVQKIHFKH